MKKWKWLLLSGLGILLVLALALPADAAGHKYVGAAKCKMCHNSPAKGAQFTQWSESKHATAFATLASEESKKAAEAKGIADPQKAAECLKCHVTGHGSPAEMLGEKYKAEEGVTCEACHGAGADYATMAIMKDKAKAMEAGLTEITEAVCKTCHNPESPTFKEFDFAKATAATAHPNPQKAAGK